MGIDDTTDPTASGDTKDPSSSGTPPEAKLYTKTEHTATIQRETAKERSARLEVERQRDELAAKLSEYETKAREAEEAKLSAAQRADLERKRAVDALTAERETWKATAEKERTLRHGALTTEASTRLVASVSGGFSHPDLTKDAARAVREHVVVQSDAQGNDAVVWQHAPGDTVPLEEGFKAFIEAGSLARFNRVATGSGAQHGAGAAGGRATLAGLSPTDKIAAGLAAQRRK